MWKERTGCARIGPGAPESLGLREMRRNPQRRQRRSATEVRVKQ